MAQIRPFSGIRYAKSDVSPLIAPPYDVLDEKGRSALQAKSPHNVVTIDLPHLPAKAAGPDAVYAGAHHTLQAWLRAGILKRDTRPAIYPYTQNFQHAGRTFHRRGFIALVKLSPFGEGQVVPHEKTYSGPIEDRLKLMRATRIQLSPIFGLFSDPRGEITSLLYKNLGRPAQSGTMNAVRNDLWSVTDANVENAVIDLMGTRPIFIADGHHRYTTALQYQAEAAQANGGPLPPKHCANYCMFVLVGMQDDGLLILPTHRMIGGLTNFDAEVFRASISDEFEMTELAASPETIEEVVKNLALDRVNTFVLFDGKTRKLHGLRLKNPDVLAALEPEHSEAWRRLDVAILQRFLIDEVLKPRFAAGEDPIRGYTADPHAIAPQVDGQRYQVAVLLRPTPLHALEDLGKANEVMPQKSTFFFPKLATGLVMNPLE